MLSWCCRWAKRIINPKSTMKSKSAWSPDFWIMACANCTHTFHFYKVSTPSSVFSFLPPASLRSVFSAATLWSTAHSGAARDYGILEGTLQLDGSECIPKARTQNSFMDFMCAPIPAGKHLQLGFTTRIPTQKLLLQPVITANLAVLLAYRSTLKQTSVYESNCLVKVKRADISYHLLDA